jgi:hypothetical protein
MIIRDELVNDIKNLLKLNQPGDGDEVIKMHIKNATRALCREFTSLADREATIVADSNGQITFPADVGYIVGLWVGDQEIQPVGQEDFQRYSSGGFYNDIVKIQERNGRWIGTLSGRNANSGASFTLLYKLNTGDVSIVPEQYARLLQLMIINDYFVYEAGESQQPQVSRIRKEMEAELARFRELQTHGSNVDVRRKSQFELDWERALRTLVYANDRDMT